MTLELEVELGGGGGQPNIGCSMKWGQSTVVKGNVVSVSTKVRIRSGSTLQFTFLSGMALKSDSLFAPCFFLVLVLVLVWSEWWYVCSEEGEELALVLVQKEMDSSMVAYISFNVRLRDMSFVSFATSIRSLPCSE